VTCSVFGQRPGIVSVSPAGGASNRREQPLAAPTGPKGMPAFGPTMCVNTVFLNKAKSLAK
jgi:hypothetical protein